MSWNYRVIQNKEDFGGKEYTSYSIHEVYYDDEGKIEMYSVQPSQIYGDNVEELSATLDLMKKALEKPVLIKNDLPK